jgi:hypothetical protein
MLNALPGHRRHRRKAKSTAPRVCSYCDGPLPQGAGPQRCPSCNTTFPRPQEYRYGSVMEGVGYCRKSKLQLST